MRQLTFAKADTSVEDLDLFLGPLDDGDGDEFIAIEDHWKMAHVLFQARIFKSVTSARKNGWDCDIPKGFSMFTVGKRAKKVHLFILNI